MKIPSVVLREVADTQTDRQTDKRRWLNYIMAIFILPPGVGYYVKVGYTISYSQIYRVGQIGKLLYCEL